MKTLFKRLTILSLCACIMVGMTITSSAQTIHYTENIETIYLNSIEEFYEYPYDPSDDSNVKKVFIINSGIQTYAICSNCGMSGMNIFQQLDEVGALSIPCPAVSGAGYSDIMSTYNNYSIKQHNVSACGYYNKTYLGKIYKVHCANSDDLGLFQSTFTIGQGTNIHCYIDPNNPYVIPTP